MANFLRSPKLSSILLSTTIVAFSISTLPCPVYANIEMAVNLNDIVFAIRVEKLIEKINRYKKNNDSKKLIESMFDLKLEIEGYTGKKINLDRQLDVIEKEIKMNSGKLQEGEMKAIRKLLGKKQKRIEHKAMYMAFCQENNISYRPEEELLMYEASHSHDKKDDNKQEFSVPIRVTIGVTVALSGLFLYFVPLPICQLWAPRLMQVGVGLAVEGTINRLEQDENKKNKNMPIGLVLSRKSGLLHGMVT